MKNPFVQMALMTAAMAAAFRENKLRDAGYSPEQIAAYNKGRTRSRDAGRKNPAGSKLLRKYYKAKTGSRGDFEEAREHYESRKS